MYKIHLFILLFTAYSASAQQRIQGRISDSSDNRPLPGASINIKGHNTAVSTDANGLFTIVLSPSDTLTVSYVGYRSKQVVPPFPNKLNIKLEQLNASLQEIFISTGYQTLPKERATGSFVQIDNELLNRSVGTHIIDRLRDVVPGLSFNRTGTSALSIRGQSTIFGNAEPLVVIDNFPFDGNLQDINPNDVESITVLKDAAAASIWGARAGNGVIVITSKKGKINRPAQVSFSSNVTIAPKPDLYVANSLSSADYIDIEKRLFQENYYDADYLTRYKPLSPAVELLYQAKDEPGKAAAINARIEALKNEDVRNDLDKYLYQKSIYQQYTLGLNGGGKQHTYTLSAGLDRSRENLVRNGYQRITVNAGNTFKLLKDRLDLSTGINYIHNKTSNNNPGREGIYNGTTGYYTFPYARLADDAGNPLPVVKDYKTSFISTAQQNGLLDWGYSPLAEVYLSDNVGKRKTLRLNAGAAYAILSGLKASILYQYTDMDAQTRNFHHQDSYYARDLINQFTQVTGTNILRPVPLGGILDHSSQSAINHTFRSQIDYQHSFAKKHELSAIGGFELRDTRTNSLDYRYYGYDIEHAKSGLVNYTDDTLPYYYDPSKVGAIPNADASGMYVDRYRSYYANTAYTYDGRFTLSASARLDQSNLFGVKTNQQGVPLWSAGLSWTLSREPFYKSGFLPYLKLRATYGYNGSVNKSVSAYTTASLTGLNIYQLPYATIINPPNPELRWERIKIINAGIDFGTKENVLSGSLEYYHKQGKDLIGDTPFPPSSGISLFRGNSANTAGNGLDIALSSKNMKGLVSWNTDLVFGYLSEKVTSYALTMGANSGGYIQSSFAIPLAGMPLYSIYSYPSAGLHPQTGDPQGYINGSLSTDYVNIISNTTTENMVYNGSARPTTFGSIRNTFSYKNIACSFNLAYRFGHYFRKASISYGNTYGLNANSGDYALRWQKPGDELNTSIPSIPATADNNRDLFYLYSNALVDKADNIRLQDIRLSYDLKAGTARKMPFRFAQFYMYASNIGLLWKATHFDVDPESQLINIPLTLSAGVKIDLN
ncbi:SusC/RagA family TonB-linked outer membrane protein [Pedobacter sp. AW31-3R]|uniref:SusC/RagA family TonB-linked outer membrane protein n=1 Tax=Pedobacter sp. AW31-3R TaxID=3445781 RepID=UPI003F9F65C6